MDGTHNCNSQEKCINTPSGVECQSRDLPLPLRMPPMPFGSIIKNKKKQDCDDGYTYSVYEQQCKGKFLNLIQVRDDHLEKIIQIKYLNKNEIKLLIFE